MSEVRHEESNPRMKKRLLTLCAALGVGLCPFMMVINNTSAERRSPTANVSPKPPAIKDIQPDHIIGKWYMGTMMGFDCDLSIDADHTMTIQTGGCFHQDPPIKLNWRIVGDKIFWSPRSIPSIFSNARWKKGFGSYLSIVRVGKNIVLVPQRAETEIKRQGYDHEYCFWRNLMGDAGLELPKEARAFRSRNL
jgi:hypothetical protein